MIFHASLHSLENHIDRHCHTEIAQLFEFIPPLYERQISWRSDEEIQTGASRSRSALLSPLSPNLSRLCGSTNSPQTSTCAPPACASGLAATKTQSISPSRCSKPGASKSNPHSRLSVSIRRAWRFIRAWLFLVIHSDAWELAER